MNKNAKEQDSARNKRLSLRSATAITSALIAANRGQIPISSVEAKDWLHEMFDFNIQLLNDSTNVQLD